MANQKSKERRLAAAPRDENGRPVLRGIHGTSSLYECGCRCAACTTAGSKAVADRRKRRWEETVQRLAAMVR